MATDCREHVTTGAIDVRVATRRARLVPCRFAFVLALLLSGPGLAAAASCTPAADASAADATSVSALDELAEVVVSGEKSTRRTRDLGAWLRQLEGQYIWEGQVDLCGSGRPQDMRPVAGESDCVSLYETSTEQLLSLYCVFDVRWPKVQGARVDDLPGREASLSPAVVVYGVVPDLPGIQFMQIDSMGMATHARGQLVGDTLTTRSTCDLPGSCQRVTRITTGPERDAIAMLIDIEVGAHRVMRQGFLMRRVSNRQLSRDRLNVLALGELELVGER